MLEVFYNSFGVILLVVILVPIFLFAILLFAKPKLIKDEARKARTTYLLLIFCLIMMILSYFNDSKEERKSNKAQEIILLGDNAFANSLYDDALLKYFEALNHSKGAYNNLESMCSIFNKIAQTYRMKEDLDKALGQYSNALEVAELMNENVLIANAEMQLGRIYYDMEKPNIGINHKKKAWNAIKGTNNEELKFVILKELASNSHALDQVGMAIKYLTAALQISKNIGPIEEEMELSYELGMLHKHNRTFDLAIDIFKGALLLGLVEMNEEYESRVLFQLGNIYFERREIDNALDYYYQAISKSTHLGDTNLLKSLYSSIIEICEMQDDRGCILMYLKKEASLDERVGNIRSLIANYIRIGDFYVNTQKIGNNAIALNKFEHALRLAEDNNCMQLQLTALNRIGDLQIKMYDCYKAIECLKKGLNILKEQGDCPVKQTLLASLTKAYECTGNKSMAIATLQKMTKSKVSNPKIKN
ncbi:MAG: tetratricopeptide repeat protein [Desulfobacteraceae bacterium]|nr:MAG: tetratricopeptide repeat protein [Desulfobacteraceae bacterium]